MTEIRSAFLPDWASPPGDTLSDLLDEQAMTQTELADRLGVTLKHVNRVVKGAASVSAELALGLEKVFGAPAAFWMTREAHYQADKARQEQRPALLEGLGWARKFPIIEMRKRGVLERHVDGPELVEELLRFLGIASPSQWKNPQVAYRKSQVFQSDPFALSAWLREGELEALAIECAPFDEDRFGEVLLEARPLTRLDPSEGWPRLQALCATAGVALVVIEAYEKAKTNGAARWLGPDKALIQLTVRHKWEDIFWFSFFHEAGHVVLHRKRDVFQDLFIDPVKRGEVDAQQKELEDEADRFAARTLIPPPHDRRLTTLALDDVPAFAKMLDIAPAIVVGRMQHEGLVPFSRGNELRRRFQITD